MLILMSGDNPCPQSCLSVGVKIPQVNLSYVSSKKYPMHVYLVTSFSSCSHAFILKILSSRLTVFENNINVGTGFEHSFGISVAREQVWLIVRRYGLL